MPAYSGSDKVELGGGAFIWIFGVDTLDAVCAFGAMDAGGVSSVIGLILRL